MKRILLAIASIIIFSKILAQSNDPILVFSEKVVKSDKLRLIYNTDVPDDLDTEYSKLRNREVRYNSKVFIESIKGNYLAYPRGSWSFEPLDEIIESLSWVILNKDGIIIAENNSVKVPHEASIAIRPSDMTYFKSDKKLTDILEATLLVRIVTKDNKKFDLPFIIKNYTAHILADLSYAQDKPNFGNVIGTVFTESLLRSQVSIAYMNVKGVNKDNYPVIFNVPIISFDHRNIILRNTELGFSVPVSILNNDKIVGYGGNIGLLKTSKKRTVFQIGAGVIGDSNTEAANKKYFYFGIDLQNVVDFLKEVTTN